MPKQKEERSQINSQCSHFKNLQKEKQNKSKANGRKLTIRIEISEIENINSENQ